jgi:DNA modification methylase
VVVPGGYAVNWEVRQGRAQDLLPAMPAASVQCVVTSPPYYGLRDYGAEGQLGLEATTDQYVAALVDVFREVRRVLREDGTAWINLGDTYAGNRSYQVPDSKHRDVGNSRGMTVSRRRDDAVIPRTDLRVEGCKPKDLIGIPWRVAFALQADGWWLRSDIVWSKPNPMPESVTDRPTKAHEYLFLLTKAERYYYDAESIKEPHAESTLDRAHLGPYYAGRGDRGEKMVARQAQGLQSASTTLGGFIQSPAGRNRRSVWTIATQPFPEAHFATFPEALVEPCILAGTSAQACEKCGAPWERLTKPSERYAAYLGKGFTDHEADMEAGRLQNRGLNRQNAMRDEAGITTREVVTTGWRPTCSCENAGSADCLVLDPFAGSGTVGVVALRHGRRFLGLELNSSYCAMARRRIAGPLFAEAGA